MNARGDVRYVLTQDEFDGHNPSRRDGVTEEAEEAARALCASVVQDAGVTLGLPQVTVSRAAVYAHRFWCMRSLKGSCTDAVAGASLLLASKLDDREQKPDVILNVIHCLKESQQQAAGATAALSCDNILPRHSPTFKRKKDQLVRAEQDILRALGYNTQVEDPFKYLVFYAKEVLMEDAALLQEAWGYLTDSFLTNACLLHDAHEVALGSIYLALRRLGRSYPECVDGTPQAWWEVFSVPTERMTAVVQKLARAYLVDPQPLPEEQPSSQSPTQQTAASVGDAGGSLPAVAQPSDDAVGESESPEPKRQRTS